MSRILSGVQSSGQLHLGNYYGAIRQFVELQGEGDDTLYFIANLHALNTLRDGDAARRLTFETACAFLALGVDPKKSTLFRQSDIAEVTQLFWVLGTVVPMSNLERAHSYKDKVANNVSPNFGLFAYPVLMAVDILIYDSDIVPVGKDQVQHVEFARDWAIKFNLEYVKGYDPAFANGDAKHPPGLFRVPSARLQEATQTVVGTNGEKMSKSYDNTIPLFGDDKAVKDSIMKKIVTDSSPVEAPKPTEKAPLYELLKLMAPPGEWENTDAQWRAGGEGYGTFKKRLLEWYHLKFDEPRKRYAELINDPAEVERLLQEGAVKARAYAAPVVERVRQAVGL